MAARAAIFISGCRSNTRSLEFRQMIIDRSEMINHPEKMDDEFG
jgi:hypothetical protein